MKKLIAFLLVVVLILTLGACGSDSSQVSSSTASTSTAEQSAPPADTSAAADTSTAAGTTAAQASKEAESSVAANAEGWTKVDKKVTVEDVEYTVNAIKMSKGSAFFKAADGNTYLLIDLNAKNGTAEEAALSSIMMFELKDGAGKTYNISLGGSASLDEEKIEMIDGSVAANSDKRGGLAYEIPENTTGLKLTIKAILGSGSQTIELN